jgi:hypothetical protein
LGPFHEDLDRFGENLAAGGETENLQRAFKKGMLVHYSPAKFAHWVSLRGKVRRPLGNSGLNREKR